MGGVLAGLAGTQVVSAREADRAAHAVSQVVNSPGGLSWMVPPGHERATAQMSASERPGESALAATSSTGQSVANKGMSAGVHAQGTLIDQTIGSLPNGQGRAAQLNADPYLAAPAWRWQVTPMYQDLGWDKPIETAMNGLAAMMFGIAGWIWQLVLFVMRLTNANVISSALGAINRGVAQLTQNRLLMSAVALGWVVTLWRIGKMALGLHIVGILRTAVVFLLPMAFLFYWSAMPLAQTGKPIAGTQSVVAPPVGSPAWIAQWGTSRLDSLADVTLEPINFVDEKTSVGDSTGPAGPQGPQGRTSTGDAISKPGCAGYQETLNQMARSGNNPSSILTSISSLWSGTYLATWEMANFGDTGAGAKVGCHLLDAVNGITPTESAAIQKASYPNVGAGSPYIYMGLQEPMDGAGKLHVFSWIACYNDGSGWNMDPAWVNVGENGPGKNAKYCESWYKGDKATNSGSLFGDAWNAVSDRISSIGTAVQNAVMKKFTDLNYWKNCAVGSVASLGVATPAVCGADLVKAGVGAAVDAAFGRDREYLTEYVGIDTFSKIENGNVSDITRKNNVDSAAARAVIDSYFGRNSMTRLGLGFITLLTALIYAFSLIGLGAGALLAQFGVVTLFIALPVTMLLIALGSQAGKKMLRMTIGLMASKVLLSVLIAVVLGLTTLGMVLVGSVTSSVGSQAQQAGFASSMFAGLMPLMSLYMVRRLCNAMGLGNITSLKGALGFSTAAAMRASNAGSLADLSRGKTGTETIAGRMRKGAKDLASKHGKKAAKSFVPQPIRNFGQTMEKKRLQGVMGKIDAERAKTQDQLDAKASALGLPGLKAEAASIQAQMEGATDDRQREALKSQLAAKNLEIQAAQESLDNSAEGRRLAQLDQTHHQMAKRYGNIETDLMIDQMEADRYKKAVGYVAGAVGAGVVGGVVGAAIAPAIAVGGVVGAGAVSGVSMGAVGAAAGAGVAGGKAAKHYRTEATNRRIAENERNGNYDHLPPPPVQPAPGTSQPGPHQPTRRNRPSAPDVNRASDWEDSGGLFIPRNQ